tara:strand:+ start:757 stop:975 length:219 start_codon:yes stop_codon:yes gene_type:complete
MSRNNGKVTGDPVIRRYKHFTADGAEDQWIVFSLDPQGRISRSLNVSTDAATLVSYGLKQVPREDYNKLKKK